nr:MAG TPA: hypothetical protein [Caudoviricetes sp.]
MNILRTILAWFLIVQSICLFGTMLRLWLDPDIRPFPKIATTITILINALAGVILLIN